MTVSLKNMQFTIVFPYLYKKTYWLIDLQNVDQMLNGNI